MQNISAGWLYPIILIAGAGVALTELLRLIERRFERWRPNYRGS